MKVKLFDRHGGNKIIDLRSEKLETCRAPHLIIHDGAYYKYYGSLHYYKYSVYEEITSVYNTEDDKKGS